VEEDEGSSENVSPISFNSLLILLNLRYYNYFIRDRNTDFPWWARAWRVYMWTGLERPSVAVPARKAEKGVFVY